MLAEMFHASIKFNYCSFCGRQTEFKVTFTWLWYVSRGWALNELLHHSHFALFQSLPLLLIQYQSLIYHKFFWDIPLWKLRMTKKQEMRAERGDEKEKKTVAFYGEKFHAFFSQISKTVPFLMKFVYRFKEIFFVSWRKWIGVQFM